jgi:hypothetical protein
MRPRNVLTETNNMRKLMGLPLLNEDSGDSIKDVKKKVLNEDRSFSLGFGNQGGLTIDETDEAEEFNKENDGAPINDVVEEEYDVEYQDDNWLVLHDDEDDEPLNEIEKAQKMAEERELKSKRTPMEDNVMQEFIEDIDGAGDGYGGELGGNPGIDVGSPQPGDGVGGLGKSPDGMVFAEDTGFAKYNITLQDKLDLLTEQEDIEVTVDDPATIAKKL